MELATVLSLEKVSRDILKKCGGGWSQAGEKPKDQWHVLLDSIGDGGEHVKDNTRRIDTVAHQLRRT
jgi:hypothetical protein